MRLLVVLPILLLGGALAHAQRVQMTWQGQVDGTALLTIQGDRVDVRTLNGSQAATGDANFRNPLPSAPVEVQAVLREGRGRVRVVEQPNGNNGYRAVVRIEDRRGGASPYTIDLTWNQRAARNGGYNGGYGNNSGIFNDNGRYRNDGYSNQDQYGRRGRATSDNYGNANLAGEMVWTGYIDNEVILTVNGRRVDPQVVQGQPVRGERAQFSRPLPRNRDTRVQLVDAQGRGEVQLIEEPSAQNGYVARIRIRDTDAGAAPYSFRLVWGAENGTFNNGNNGGLFPY